MALIIAIAGAILSATDISVTVTDRELDIPLEGAAVQLSSLGWLSPAVLTGADGKASLPVPEGFSRGTLIAQLPGYETERVHITAGQRSAGIAMAIAGVIEGKELVVERETPGKTDERAGVSVVMEADEMDTTANVGVVEDVMSSIKTLPGVGFSGGWNAQPSIRGGYPDEMGTVLDGVYLLYPFHWGGAFSIFNPNMVSSARMSHGIFSARYGRAMSGLLEVSTVRNEDDAVRIDAIASTTSAEAFALVPFGKKAGIFAGGKVTFMESVAILNDSILGNEPKLSDTVPTMPFIRDFYAKAWLDPASDLSITANGFFGSDGIGTRGDTTNGGVRTVSEFDWLNLMGFAALNVKWTPSPAAAFRFLGSYNNNTMDFWSSSLISGTRTYSAEFKTTYGPQASDSYSLTGLDTEIKSRQTIEQGQGKIEADILLGKAGILSVGAEEVFQFFRSGQEYDGWRLSPAATGWEIVPERYSLDRDGNRVLNGAAYALWGFGEEQSTLSGELGLRGEHFYLWNDSYELNTWPSVSPRFSMIWTPVRDSGWLDSLKISAGTGLFALFPDDAIAADESFGIESFEVGPNRSWFQVLGAEAETDTGWIFRLEGYYKYYFDRFYLTTVQGAAGADSTYSVHTDGSGYASGFDLMLQKKNGRRFDGYLTYSFVLSQYRNPAKPATEGETTASGDPLDQWYFPSFHRFHTLNLVLNWKPVSGFVFTMKASVASGRPMTREGPVEMVRVTSDGTVMELYRRNSSYDPDLRTELSCPVDFRLSYSDYYPRSKIRWEFYAAVENAFVNLYRPTTNASFDPFTGKEIEGSNSADYNIGIPSPSIGYKISY